MRYLRHGRRGLTLIEILVAMAIFVIGLLAVLRIFPRSLGLVTTTSDRNSAVRLAEATLNSLRAAEQRLPDLLLTAGTTIDVNPGPPGSPNPGFGFDRPRPGSDLESPYDLDLPYQDPGDEPDLLHRLSADERLVVGERATVGRDQGGGPQAYHVLFGPIEPQPGGGGGDVAVLREFRRVEPYELKRTVVGGVYRDRPVFAFADGGIDDFTGVPAGDRLIFELDSDERLLMVDLAYRDDLGVVRWVKTEPLVIPGRTPGGAGDDRPYFEVEIRHPNPPNPVVTRVVPNSLRIRQVVGRAGGPFGRFVFDDSGFAHGVLFFAPEMAGETLYLEYVVDDWRNLRETLPVEVDNSGKIVVPNDELQLDARRLDLDYVPLIVVVGSGQPVPVDLGRWDQDHANKGLVPIDAAATLPSVPGKQELHVFFRREGNWAAVPSIAAADYTLAYDAYPGSPLNSLVEYAPHSDGQHLNLYFRPSEAGKTVAVGYEVDLGGSREPISGEMHVIPPRPNDQFGGEPRCRVTLRRPNVAFDTANPARPYLHRIEGRSLRLRVVYDDEQVEREAEPTRSAPVPGTLYLTAERLLELGWYVRRNR